MSTVQTGGDFLITALGNYNSEKKKASAAFSLRQTPEI